jgi:hypothetical protein
VLRRGCGCCGWLVPGDDLAALRVVRQGALELLADDQQNLILTP